MTGLLQLRMAVETFRHLPKNLRPAEGLSSPISEISPPAQKAFSPAPVSTTTPTESSVFASSNADELVESWSGRIQHFRPVYGDSRNAILLFIDDVIELHFPLLHGLSSAFTSALIK
jgi:hypothetical protein